MPETQERSTTATPAPGGSVIAEAIDDQTQVNDADAAFASTVVRANMKRTYDAYQADDLQHIRENQRVFTAAADQLQKDLAAINNLTVQALQNGINQTNNVNSNAVTDIAQVRAHVLKVADIAADGLWTDQLNPVTRGAGNDLTGQAPVNANLTSTASLDAAYTNLSAQVSALTGQVTGLAALVAQIVQNAQQAPKA